MRGKTSIWGRRSLDFSGAARPAGLSLPRGLPGPRGVKAAPIPAMPGKARLEFLAFARDYVYTLGGPRRDQAMNPKTAKGRSLTIPTSLLLRADQVIE